jgi:hypothetical protein
MSVTFRPGGNIAMKVPPHVFEPTVSFYRDTVGLEEVEVDPPSAGFRFGSMVLWIDPVPAMSQAELWLELYTNDVAGAARALDRPGIVRCDAIEPLGEGFQGLWIASPASIIHMVRRPDAWSATAKGPQQTADG